MDILQYLTEKSLVLIPALLILGQIIKGIEWIPDKFIPLILLPFGILGSVGLNTFCADTVIQGILVTGAAVFGNQIVKQLKKKEE
ncbi:MAG: holin [Clostridiales bacterium]|jgi:hypothetical protein|nr:holin [Clostridiales bacterium]